MYNITQRQRNRNRRGRPLCLPDFLSKYDRATTGGCPYNDNDAVNMIRHNNEFIYIYSRVMEWDFIPHGLIHVARIVQYHFPVHNVPEQTFPVLRTNGDEIGPGPGIIITLQSNGTAVVVNNGIICHINILVGAGPCACPFSGIDPFRGPPVFLYLPCCGINS